MHMHSMLQARLLGCLKGSCSTSHNSAILLNGKTYTSAPHGMKKARSARIVIAKSAGGLLHKPRQGCSPASSGSLAARGICMQHSNMPTVPHQVHHETIKAQATNAGSGVEQCIDRLTEKVHGLAADIKHFVPAKADEVLSSTGKMAFQHYIATYVDLLVLEADEEVKDFVATLKDWPLTWLQQDGRVLLGLTGAPAGEYYGDQVMRLFQEPQHAENYSYGRGQADLPSLPRHSLAPGDVVLLTRGKKGPLLNGGWREDMMCGVVIERSKSWIKVAFETGPDRDELQSHNNWRLDMSVNTLTTERALLALVSMWSWLPFSTNTWSLPFVPAALQSVASRLVSMYSRDDKTDSCTDNPCKGCVDEFFEGYYNEAEHRRHIGVFEGSPLARVIVSADKSFDWSSLPSAAGGMPERALQESRNILPTAGRPNQAATATYLKKLEQQGNLATSGHRIRLDASQVQAVATAVLNPLTLLHGPPGTGKTTTIAWFLAVLRKRYRYKGTILAAAQSNVAVDNMLETAMRLGGLRVLRIGEPVRVRGSLQRFTLRAQLDSAVKKDSAILKAHSEQQRLRQKLRSMRKNGPYSDEWYDRREMYERLDELRGIKEKHMKRLTQQLLAAAHVVGVTCAGAAGPELTGAAFDMVVIDEGSQASEPEALIPLMKGSRRAVIVGDHKQLPPIVKNEQAAAGGLGQSLFERLMILGAPSAMLQVQYRSHPELMSFINKQFYNGLLSNGVAAADRPAPTQFSFPNPKVPIVFVAVEGREKSSSRGSKINEQEADAIETLVQLLTGRCGLAARSHHSICSSGVSAQ